MGDGYVQTVFVWIVSAMTVTKVVEGCVYIRRRYYGTLPRVGGEFELSALSPLSLRFLSLALSSNATTLNHLIRLRGSQGIQIWKQRTVLTPFNVDGSTVFNNIRQLLYPGKSFPRPEQKRILAAFTRGTSRAVSIACMHPKRLPLARKYCIYLCRSTHNLPPGRTAVRYYTRHVAQR